MDREASSAYARSNNARLLFRPQRYLDECLISYLVRIAENNGFKHIGHLLHYAGLSWQSKRVPIRHILTGEFQLQEYFIKMGLHYRDPESAKIYSTFQRIIDTPYVFVKHPKICPLCLAEYSYCRSSWAFLPIVVCLKHKKLLVDLHARTGERLSWYRSRLDRFDDSTHVSPWADIAPADAISFTKYFEALLSGRATAKVPAILCDLKFHEALTLVHCLAHYRARLLGDAFNPMSLDNNSLAQHYRKIWRMLHEWPDSLYQMLGQYLDRPMSSRAGSGITKHYRDLYERLHRQRENKGIARLKSEFDRYVEHQWPGLVNTEQVTRISMRSAHRSVVSKKEAAEIIGCHPERIDKLVIVGKLTRVLFEGKAHYRRPEAEELARLISSNWSMSMACEELQITRYQLKQLLDAEVVLAIQKPDRFNRDWLVDKLQCQKLVADLKASALARPPSGPTLTLVGIQKQGFAIVRLISHMLSGQLEYTLRDDNKWPFSLRQFTSFKIVE